MKVRLIAAIAVLLGVCVWPSVAQNYDTNNVIVQIVVGSGLVGRADGPGTQCNIYQPQSPVADSSGNVFFLEPQGSYVRKITPDANVISLVRAGRITTDMLLDHSNALWLSETSAELIRIPIANPVPEIVLTNFGSGSICVDSVNRIYLSRDNRIYRFDPLTRSVEVFVGSGNQASIDGTGIFCAFNLPHALACDSADNIYVFDDGGHYLRKVDQGRNVVTIAGNGLNANLDGVGMSASFSGVRSMCVDNSGNLIIGGGFCVRKVDAATNVTTLAGSFSQSGYTNGPGNLARFNEVTGVCFSRGKVYVTESPNHRVRQLSFNPSPEQVASTNLQSGAQPSLTITGTVGRVYRVLASSDMKSWNTVATLLLTSSPYLWMDNNPVAGNTFYRAVLVP